MKTPIIRFAKTHPRLHRAFHFTLAALLAFTFERWLDRTIEENEQGNILTQRISSIATFYHRLVTASPRTLKARFTVLVELSRKTTPLGIDPFNVCPERAFIGELLKSLASAHPNVVVIDKYFGAATCLIHDPNDPNTGNLINDPGTVNLIAGVRTLCKDQVTVVVGRAVDEKERREPGVASRYHLETGLDFTEAGNCVTESILNINLDLRRASLWWPNVEPVADKIVPPRSLALVAGLAAAPDLLNNSRLAGRPPTSLPPYVSFVEIGQFATVTLPANDAMCPSTKAPFWRACEESELKQQVRLLTRGKVVVIGEDDPRIDRHQTVVGEVAGYVLQANYIESLLDDRLIRPVPEALNELAGLMIFMTFEYLFWRYHRIRALASVALLFVGVTLTVYLAVTLFGYYLNPTTISVLAILNSRVIDLFLK